MKWPKRFCLRIWNKIKSTFSGAKVEVNELISKWFNETFQCVEQRLKTCEDVDMVLVSSLKTGGNYLRAILLLLDNNHIAPSKALLRIITELTAKLLWCLYVPNSEAGQVSSAVQKKIDRWKKTTAIELAKGLEEFSYAIAMNKQKISEEINRLRSIANSVLDNQMPSTKQIFQAIPDWYEKVYPQAYRQFNTAIHPDLKLLENLIEKHGNLVACQNEDLGEKPDLLKYCVLCSYNLNSLVRNHYHWDSEEMGREYNACMSYLER